MRYTNPSLVSIGAVQVVRRSRRSPPVAVRRSARVGIDFPRTKAAPPSVAAATPLSSLVLVDATAPSTELEVCQSPFKAASPAGNPPGFPPCLHGWLRTVWVPFLGWWSNYVNVVCLMVLAITAFDYMW